MHRPVLLTEIVELLRVERGGSYIDATAGAGGVSEELLRRSAPDGKLLAIDKDPEAAENLEKRLEAFGTRCEVVNADFSDLLSVASERGFRDPDGIVFDLGLSSDQLDNAERGFSLKLEGPLDMRMNRNTSSTAADIVNYADEGELRRIFRSYGEERRAGRVARAIVAERNRGYLDSTTKLADTVAGVLRGAPGRIHPATRVFQALRIAVNEELDGLSKGLEQGLELLKTGGRLAAVSFHSLEDRIVKKCFVQHRGRMVSLQQGGARWEGALPVVKILTGKPVAPSSKECKDNPRARSAKLRVAEKLP